ncbi:MAG: response regulator [Patescibacteria group bacterium]
MAKKVLIVEDEEIIVDLLQKKLKNEGYDALVARDGDEGLKVMRKSNPDLILLDILMPKMSGLEVMAEMQKDERLKKIPIIVISNSGQPVEIDKAQRFGAKDWLVKAEFDPQEVIDKIEKQIGK